MAVDVEAEEAYKFPAETYGWALRAWAKSMSSRHLDEIDGDTVKDWEVL